LGLGWFGATTLLTFQEPYHTYGTERFSVARAGLCTTPTKSFLRDDIFAYFDERREDESYAA
jgi:hypothetical protein